MFSSPERVIAALVLGVAVTTAGAQTLKDLGRPATPKELAAWDIDVRPDFKGLPKGAGSVSQGQDVWEAKCASCHGIFGESNEVFAPLVGGTTAEDIKRGRVARLTDPSFPGRTTLMKVPTISTLWDYINRAMPWNAPKSLKVDEVYAVTAFMLNLGGIVPDDFVLSEKTMKDAQARLPNRLGMTTQHHLWPGKGMGGVNPDTKAVACMRDCPVEASVSSMLPDHARNAHGNLAEQNRIVGPQHGADTTQAPQPDRRIPTPPLRATALAARPDAAVAVPPSGSAGQAQEMQALLLRHACTGCHAMQGRMVGPSFKEIAQKYAGMPDAAAYLAERIRKGGSGVWGSIPMPAQGLAEDDAKLVATWLAVGRVAVPTVQ